MTSTASTVAPTQPSSVTPSEEPVAGGRRRRGFLISVIRSQPQALIGLIILFAFILIAVFAPYIEPYDPNTKVGPVYAPPGNGHVLGLDDGGVDMLSLLIQGSRVSLVVGFAAALVAMLIGGSVGVISGFFGGKTDITLMRITDYFLVIPDIPLMIVAAAVFGRVAAQHHPDHRHHLLDEHGAADPGTGQERAGTRLRQTGAGAGRPQQPTGGKHVLPQVAPLLIANTVLMVALAIFAETYITFLGLGDPSQISWGRLIENAFKGDAVLNNAWWAIVPPGVCVTLVILACTMVGQSMEDALNPRLKVGAPVGAPLPAATPTGRLDSE